ncbi:methionine ABC transporter ATP-binding protein [Nicoliella spurrieriana]|uniref:Methionine ABC transporter ATP-binding protein n=1 Tax=Nicoliella spurrieriana TaxID=2925830 RepID=A0A976RSQ9_9LACO|nr:methionine ABC transporter ATP-binding protein [Nicoliella spurrieriana]UQS87124.1 methionine ABC transporter ATP-binding protein [Nicoliella spurrieriana]
MMAQVELKHIDVTFKQKKQSIKAVSDVSLSIEKGDIFGIVGYSGAGKSTLVRVVNRLQEPTAGEVIINGQNIEKFNGAKLRQVRRKIGIIFQHFNLMNARTIFNNVEYPLLGTKVSKHDRQAKVTKLLKLVGLFEKKDYYPSQLSGGQKQRVAIARALASDPEILISDEATSALDPKTTQSILRLLHKLNQELNLTILLITHEMDAVKSVCNKVAVMDTGKVVEEGSLLDIFSAPKNDLTRDFIETTNQIKPALRVLSHQEAFVNYDNRRLVELQYLGDNTNNPVIIELFEKFNVTANIIFGNVEFIQGVPLGHLIVTLSGTDAEIAQAKEYLHANQIHVHDIDLARVREQEALEEREEA